MVIINLNPNLIPHLKSLSEQVTQKELDEGRVYPNLNRIQEVSLAIAVEVGKYAASKNLCHLHPTPESIVDLVKSHVYTPVYSSALKANWSWPKL